MVAQLIEHWTRALKCSGWNPKQISILLDVCISSALYLSHSCILIEMIVVLGNTYMYMTNS